MASGYKLVCATQPCESIPKAADGCMFALIGTALGALIQLDATGESLKAVQWHSDRDFSLAKRTAFV